MKRKVILPSIALAALMAALLTPMRSMADIPELINYQGRITDNLGAPVPDGSYELIFKIWDAPTGGDEKWSETHSSVTVTDGLCAVLLGSVAGLPDTVFNRPDRFLSITVDGEEISPRMQLVSVPYAYNARSLQLIATDSPPPCDNSRQGSLYYDGTQNEPCYCDGTRWAQLDGGGFCGPDKCADLDNDGYDRCDPSDPDDTDGQPADCDDSDASANPGAAEICGDGIDNDCDGFIDCDDFDCGCTDADNDGYGAEGTACCSVPDCDDNDASVNPGATEICDDGIDNDCDGLTDCDDPDCGCTIDADGDGYGVGGPCCTSPDCDDSDATINPGATEICDDGIDNDCDGLVDCDDPDCGCK